MAAQARAPLCRTRGPSPRGAADLAAARRRRLAVARPSRAGARRAPNGSGRLASPRCLRLGGAGARCANAPARRRTARRISRTCAERRAQCAAGTGQRAQPQEFAGSAAQQYSPRPDPPLRGLGGVAAAGVEGATADLRAPVHAKTRACKAKRRTRLVLVNKRWRMTLCPLSLEYDRASLPRLKCWPPRPDGSSYQAAADKSISPASATP